MLKAKQDLVNQHANLSLVEIRKAELTYFTNFFSIFATQCFLITTFEVIAISQRPPNRTIAVCGNACPLYILLPAAVFITTSVALNCLIILISVYVSVFGNWMAIHGKEGAILDVILGMIDEQSKVLYYFLGACFLFQAQLFCAFFVLMDRPYAIGCAGIMFIFAVWTYRSSLRIYNNFYFDQRQAGWNYDVQKHSVDTSGLTDEFIEELMRDNSDINAENINRLYEQSLEKGVLQPEDSSEKKRHILLGLISSSVEQMGRMSESVGRMSFHLPRPSLSLPTIPNLVPRMSFTELPSLGSLRPSIASSKNEPMDNTSPSPGGGGGGGGTVHRSSIGGGAPVHRSSITGGTTTVHRSSIGGGGTVHRSSITGSVRSSHQTATNAPGMDNQPRPSFMRASLGAIGNTFGSFANPLSFSLRGGGGGSQQMRELEMEQFNRHQQQYHYVVGELYVKVVPHNSGQGSYFSFLWGGSSSSTSTTTITPTAVATTEEDSPTTTSSSGQEKWMRYYFIMKGTKLYYYENEFALLTSPGQPINRTKPIDLNGYELKKGSSVPPFAFSLRPLSSGSNLKTWLFRCSDIQMFNYWTEKMEQVLEEIQQRELMKEFM
jgi:hypothetical protein